MGNPNLGRERTPCSSSPITHDASGARVTMAAEEVPDLRGPGDKRKRIPHRIMRVKLLNYIGQVFECKADSSHYSRRVIANRYKNLQGTRGERQGRIRIFDDFFLSPPAPCPSPLARLTRCSRHVMNHHESCGLRLGCAIVSGRFYAPAFLDIAYPIT